MMEQLTVMVGLVGLALLPHLVGLVLLAVALYLLWQLWPYLLLAIGAIPVLLVGGALSAGALLAMAYGFVWLVGLFVPVFVWAFPQLAVPAPYVPIPYNTINY